MKRLILKSIGAFVMGSIVLTSCLDDPEPVKLDALSDVFVQKIVQDDEVKYGIAFWVYANKALSAAEVAGPEETTWTLVKDEGTSQVFSLFPKDEDYGSAMPEAGDYKFTVTSTQEGEEPLVVTDKLSDQELGTLEIESTEFTGGQLKTTWAALENTGNYLVRLYDSSGKMIFSGEKVSKEKTEFSFGNSSNGWLNSAVKGDDGKSYRLEVVAILYEANTTAETQDYNVQFISIASKEIVWGEEEE